MSLIDLSFLCIFLVFAHLSESRVLILRDYDDEPFGLNHGDKSINEGIEPQQEAISISSNYRPKKTRSSKNTILQYGRHAYHLDDFKDLKQLWLKISELKKPLKDDSVSYDYMDVNDSNQIDSDKDGEGEYPKDLLILSETPLHCNGENCEEDRKAFRKFSRHREHTKNRLRFMKRFQIVDRRQPSKKPKRSKSKKEKKKSSKKHRKKKNDSPESMDSNSEERSSESWESDKKKKYSFEESTEFIKKPKKKYASTEEWTNELNSIEKIPKKKKKNKKAKYESSGETERKTTAEDDYVMQGNKIFHSNDRKQKKRHKDDTRRRLEHFFPKRYHWEPEEIHSLGYFWYNGPKGAYPAPQPL